VWWNSKAYNLSLENFSSLFPFPYFTIKSTFGLPSTKALVTTVVLNPFSSMFWLEVPRDFTFPLELKVQPKDFCRNVTPIKNYFPKSNLKNDFLETRIFAPL